MKNELEISMKLDGEDFLYAAVEIDLGMLVKKLMGICNSDEDTKGIDMNADDFIEHLKRVNLLQEEPKSKLKEVYTGDTISFYDENDNIVKSQKTTKNSNDDDVTIDLEYDEDQRIKKFTKTINNVRILDKCYAYDRYGSVTDFTYINYMPNGNIRTKIQRKYIDGTVMETIITGRTSGMPIRNEYPGCYLNKSGSPIHEITGIQINSDNYESIL